MPIAPAGWLTVAGLALLLVLSYAAQAASPWTGTWIWNETPRENLYFRKMVEVGPNIAQAKLAITADNIYTLCVNGEQVGSDSEWTNIEVYDVTSRIKPGRNVIAVKATDPGADIGALLVECAVTYADGSALIVGTDKTWKMSPDEAPGWTSADFDDSRWAAPKEIGKPPIAPWGGLEHPSLVPKARMETVAVYWPKVANPGDTLKVVCKVRPESRIAVDSPVCLRVLSEGATVCEQWIEPDTPITTWEPGKVRTITFPSFYLPIYVPRGKMQARVVTSSTEGTNVQQVWVGPRPAPAKPKAPVALSSLRVLPARMEGAVALRVSVKTTSVEKGSPLLLTLMKGEEMWFAANLPADGMVALPEDFPRGDYTARVFQHQATSDASAECQVTVPGPEKTSWRPLGYGCYVDRDSVRHRWYINRSGALIWDGKPYIPVGAMFLSRFFGDFLATDVAHNEETYKDDLARLKQIKAAGVTDLYLNPCREWLERPAWVWRRWADMCEEIGINYGLQVTNQIQPLKGFHIAQDEYLVRIKGGETAKAEITGTYVGRPDAGGSVLYAAFEPTSGDLIDFGRAAVGPARTGVHVEATPRVPEGAEISVHFIPEYTFSGDMHDYWQGINEQYERELDAFFGSLHLGPGFRLWIDPLDNEQSFRDLNRLLPHSAQFRAMFAEWLKQKYGSTGACVSAWSLSEADGITDFSQLARLIPLGKASPDSDAGYALDDSTHQVYRVDLAKSAMWLDMLRFRDSSIAEFNSRVAEMIKAHHDAPVVLKATDTDCFTNLRTHGGFDGVGMEAYGSAPELVRGCGGGVYSRCKMANRTMWTLVTETGLASPDVPIGYPDPMRLVKELGSMAEMNAKGTFYFLLAAGGGRPGEGWYQFNLTEDPRQLYWMGAFSRMMKSAQLESYEPDVDYYFPGSIAGQHNGFARSRPAFLSDIPSQSVAGDSGRWVAPASTQIPSDAERLIVNLEDSPATEIYKQAFEEALKTHEVAVVGHRRNLGALSIDSYYTDKFVKGSAGQLIQVLKPTATSVVFAKTPDGDVYGLEDGNLTILTTPDWLSSVRKVAGDAQRVDFFRDVLGLKELDLGKAFQGMNFGPYSYLWNMTGEEHTLVLDTPGFSDKTPEDAWRVRVTPAKGRSFSPEPGESVELALPARAEKPATIENLWEPGRISGIDTANLAAAMQEWSAAQERAKRAGIETTVMPPSNNWREIYNLAADLQKKADDALRTVTASRMSGVEVDGDLSEWAQSKAFFLKVDVGQDFSTIADYDGARFHVGYDDENLYLAGDVTDEAVVNNYRLDNLWNGDGIEVFIDLRPDVNPLSHNYTADCFQFIFAPTSLDGTPSMVCKNPGLPPGFVPPNTRWAVKKTGTGWRFEAAIPRADLNGYALKPGGVIGFNIQLDDSDGGDRSSAKLWRGGKDASRNRLSLGRLVLGQ